MKAKFVKTWEDQGGSGFMVRKFLFKQELATGPSEFVIVAPYLRDRGVQEGLKFKDGWIPGPTSVVSLKLTLGNTVIITTWSQNDLIQGEFILGFCLDLHRRVVDGIPNFDAELEINKA